MERRTGAWMISSTGLANSETHLDRLQTCPEIESYNMSLFYGGTSPRRAPVALKFLKELTINLWVPNALSNMLNSLVLPSLSELKITMAGGCMVSRSKVAPELPAEVLHSLIKRSGCILWTLDVKGMKLAPDALQSLQASIGSITVVDFCCEPHNNSKAHGCSTTKLSPTGIN